MTNLWRSFRSVLAFTLFACTLIKCSSKEESPQGIQFINADPIMGENESRIYQVPPYTVLQAPLGISNVAADGSSKEAYAHIIYVFHRDSSYGYAFYDALPDSQVVRVKADSVIRFVKSVNRFESAMTKKPDSSYWSADKSTYQERYNAPGSDSTPGGHVRFFFSRNLGHLRESLSEGLDSARGMKLYRYEFVSDPFFDEYNNVQWPETRTSTEMKEIPVGPEVQGYINRYKKLVAPKK